MEQTATTKPRSLALGAAVSVIIVILLGAVAISRHSPSSHPEKSDTSAPKGQLAAQLAMPVPGNVCASCGTVEIIRVVEVRDNALRAGAGSAGGALSGNDHAGGKGSPTTPGAPDGSLSGNETEKNAQKRVSYRVTVRMDDASLRTVAQATAPSVAVGDRVRIANGALVEPY